nr:peptidyl-prolyl cis-trans isomerase CYP95-like [Aegilops tauschii subsp. strangulata]
MPRDWGDGSGRPKRPLEKSRATSRASPDGHRQEADLRRQLTSRESRRSPARDAQRSRSPARDSRRSPPRDSRRSPPRSDRRSPARGDGRRSPQRDVDRRSPARESRRDRARSPSPIECPNPLMCYLCKGSGHPAALCPDRPVSKELMMYGHGI